PKLLGLLGVYVPRNSSQVPGGQEGVTAAGAVTTPSPAASVPPAPHARRGGLLSGLRQQGAASGQSRRNCGAFGAGCADGLKPLVACMGEVSVWGEMAVAVERKPDTGTWTAEEIEPVNHALAA